MFGRREIGLPDLCQELAEAVLRLDAPASTRGHRDVVERVPRAGVDELSAGLLRLASALERVALGNGTMLAGLTAGLIEAGADPLPVLDVLVDRVATGLEMAATFGSLADHLGGDVVAPTSADEYRALREKVGAAAGLSAEDAGELTQAWFTVNDWIPALLVPLQQKRARQALPERERLTAATAAMVEYAEDATWLLGLLLVLDDEPLLVLHRPSGRAYELTISGVGDNFQLHTLLAATLIGDPDRGLIPGERPHPAWTAAATNGDLAPPDGLRGQFNLVDALGGWIWNEGRPADIPLLGDHRVVVLDPPPFVRTWNIGRTYPLMPPFVALDRILPADEAAAWLARVASARELGR